jgi:undecaprenyl-diphosphatase
VLDTLLHADAEIGEAVAQIRTAPLTAVLVVASAAWVKGPLFVAFAALRDVSQRRLLPLYALATVTALLLASLVTDVLKRTFDRARPPHGSDPVSALVDLPTSASFPSGHASTAFAAAVALAVLMPRWRVPALAIAATVGFSRIYLGVHYTLDVFVGALLGAAIGYAVARAAQRLMPQDEAPVSSVVSGISYTEPGVPPSAISRSPSAPE